MRSTCSKGHRSARRACALGCATLAREHQGLRAPMTAAWCLKVVVQFIHNRQSVHAGSDSLCDSGSENPGGRMHAMNQYAVSSDLAAFSMLLAAEKSSGALISVPILPSMRTGRGPRLNIDKCSHCRSPSRPGYAQGILHVECHSSINVSRCRIGTQWLSCQG